MICAAAGDHHRGDHGLWATEKQGQQQQHQAASTGRLLMDVLRRRTLSPTNGTAANTTQAASEPLTSPIELASYPKKKESPSPRTDAGAWEKEPSATSKSFPNLGQQNHHNFTPQDATAAIWHSNSTTASRRRAPSSPARSLSTPPSSTAPVTAGRSARSASLDSAERRLRSASIGGSQSATRLAPASKTRPCGHERRVTESEVIWKGVWD